MKFFDLPCGHNKLNLFKHSPKRKQNGKSNGTWLLEMKIIHKCYFKNCLMNVVLVVGFIVGFRNDTHEPWCFFLFVSFLKQNVFFILIR